jgi:deazaflavin-dependent oxidoreductase (nitroreductase family)
MDVTNKPSGNGRAARRSTTAAAEGGASGPAANTPAKPAASPAAEPAAKGAASASLAAKSPAKPAVKPTAKTAASPAKPAVKTAAKSAAASRLPAPASERAPRPGAAREPGAASGTWGQGLPAYPAWMERYLPAMHGGFNALNKYLSVPLLKAGLGRYMSTPLMGYLMILRTRGRKSGEMRDAPLGYAIVGDAVYCLAGFGRKTHWFQNILVDPKVEVILSSRAFSGLAEEVTDPAERRRVLPIVLKSMGVVAGAMGMGNVWKMTPAEIDAKCEGLPLVRVRATGIAAGPEDPGGWFWVVPLAASGAVAFLWWRARRRGCRAAGARR